MDTLPNICPDSRGFLFKAEITAERLIEHTQILITDINYTY